MIEGTMNLSAEEIRVLGCLLEKQRTTPDLYPLTLNALRLACNQSTNRDPVVGYDDGVIRDALHRLERRGFTRLASGRGSRAPKYRHLLADALPMGDSEQALICVLMLRGTQTPGELKQRAERMHPFAGLEEVQDTLRALIERGLVACLDRRPGQKEERYAQLLEDRADNGALARRYLRDELPSDGDAEPASSAPQGEGAPAAGEPAPSLHERVARLEREMADLRAGRDGSTQALSSDAISVMSE
ncbi:MAG TPA: YceH family protein [Solirubrobacteraceae bacterium]|nr:YceH family protein [Solirubrobacteraceae bacterium]